MQERQEAIVVNPFTPISQKATDEILSALKEDYAKITTQAFKTTERIFGDAPFALSLLGAKTNDDYTDHTAVGILYTIYAGNLTGRKNFGKEIPAQYLLKTLLEFGLSPSKEPEKASCMSNEYLEKVKADAQLMRILLAIKEQDRLDDSRFETETLKGATQAYRFVEQEGEELN